MSDSETYPRKDLGFVTKPLEPEEESTARLLERAGLSRSAARVLAALLRGGGHGAQELADATGLARQDVTPASRELEARGLLRVEQHATGGRPSNRYHLAREPREALRALTAQRRKAVADELAALDALDARFP